MGKRALNDAEREVTVAYQAERDAFRARNTAEEVSDTGSDSSSYILDSSPEAWATRQAKYFEESESASSDEHTGNPDDKSGADLERHSQELNTGSSAHDGDTARVPHADEVALRRMSRRKMEAENEHSISLQRDTHADSLQLSIGQIMVIQHRRRRLTYSGEFVESSNGLGIIRSTNPLKVYNLDTGEMMSNITKSNFTPMNPDEAKSFKETFPQVPAMIEKIKAADPSESDDSLVQGLASDHAK